MRRIDSLHWLWLGAILVLTAWALWPGLHGGFLFDDTSNLEPLGAYGTVDSPSAVARYATSGIADPTGRPVALLSFLIDAHNWPADPYPFKRTNLILHLLNGLLLFAALVELGRAIKLDRERSHRAALLAAGLWMLHPFFVSTTLYIVQREAMLPATFTFGALWAWLVFRRRLLAGQQRAIRGMAIVVVVGTALSTLSKANGILVPALLLVVDCCLPAAEANAAGLRTARRWLLWLPTIVLLAAVLMSIPGNAAFAVANRTWTLGQRMLTEPRVLFDYLAQLWIPRPFSRGLFNDGLVVSRSLLSPWTTLPALAGLIVLAWIGWSTRTRAPAIAMTIGFYLVGQSLESGPVPLEIYFEHRNYLPAALMFWPLALWLTGEGSLQRLRIALMFTLPLLFALETRLNASLWGDATQQALVWGQRNPDSPRAQAYAAQYELSHGQPGRAEQRLRNALLARPLEIQLLVNLVDTRCQLGGMSGADQSALLRSFEQAPDPTFLASKWLLDSLPTAMAGTCHGFGIAQADQLAQAFARNPVTATLPGRQSEAQHLLGEIALVEGNAATARAAFDRAYSADLRLDTVLQQAAELASAGQPTLALQHLDLAASNKAKPWYRWRHMADLHGWVLERQGFWQRQIDELRGKILDDMRNRN